MRELPIRFDAHDVRAILDCRKTQTRLVVKPQPGPHAWIDSYGDGFVLEWDVVQWGPNLEMGHSTESRPIKCPYGKPGDRLWVRETWQHVYSHEESESWELPHIVSTVIGMGLFVCMSPSKHVRKPHYLHRWTDPIFSLTLRVHET